MTSIRKSPAGRRPGDSGTREAILESATAAFFEHGYDGATMRGIARAADVDPALVMHFFGSKDGLFRAVIETGANPMRRIAEYAEGPTEGMGERLIRGYLDVWEEPATASRVYVVLRAVATAPSAAGMLKGFITEILVAPLSGRVDADEARLRATLCGAHLAGMSMIRYILKVEPLASIDPDRLAAIVGPCLQHYLAGELGEAPVAPS